MDSTRQHRTQSTSRAEPRPETGGGRGCRMKEVSLPRGPLYMRPPRENGCESHLKIVLLGGRNSGKSSVGNLILGREEFVTRERTTCSRRQGVVAGRWTTVVDTPGWWCDFGTRDTAELVKREIVGSVLLCYPGPHVFLVVVKACSLFSEQRQRALEQHVALLGETVWRHCIALFTCVDGVHDECPETMDDSAFTWLIEKCGRRCHHFMLTGDTVGSRVTQLLVKIQKLATENANRLFEIEPSSLHRINQNIKTVEERALQRFLKMKEHRAQMQEDLHHLSDIRVVVVGAKGSGKTSVVNTIVGGGDGRRRGIGRTARCEIRRAAVLGRDVTAVDTPGWALLLVVRVDRAFSDANRRAAQEHVELLLGPGAWRHTLLVFSFGDWLGDTSIERYVESEGEPLRWLVDRCGNRYHVVYNKSTGDAAGVQVAELVGKVEEMVAANGGCAPHQAGGSVTTGRLEEQRRAEEERASQRLLVKTEQRQALRSQLEKLNCVPELKLVLLGGRNTGKSSCGNTILGRAGFHAGIPTATCAERRAHVRGVAVSVLDMPHWPPSSRDHDPLMRAAVTSGLSALLLVVNVSSSFTSSLWEALEKQMLGGAEEEEEEERWSRAMVLFSHGDWLGNTSIEERIESEGEALRRLVDRCGNRYHVLDNRHQGDRSQVYQLLDQIEEMLVGARLALLQRGDPIGKSVTLAARHSQAGLEVCHRKMQDVSLPCTNNSQPLDCPADTRSCLVVALPKKTRSALNVYIDMNNQTLCAASGLRGSDKMLRWTLRDMKTVMEILPQWSWISSPCNRTEATSEGQGSVYSPRHRGSLLASHAHHQSTPVAAREDVMAARSLWQPRDYTLKKLLEAGDLQALMDQWGSSSLEELEAFVDAYFEMVWEQAMCLAPAEDFTEPGAATEEAEHSAASSIAEKLSKLDLLEDIQRDLTEIKQSVDKCWKITQELMEAHKGNERRHAD
ncbi:GTPase IMAP family member 8 [Merluccius polli]|uniref:GTPase IMAP family member 8 n=1 Tax=Merluccius polli TaxID=89951 RepID=A0AA47MCT3_MERPO|nr:GTPase IMAP family member 8 [Merluccius polli]